MNILFISLGCDKNLVDSEVMLGILAKDGHQMVDDETMADVIIINTCCFIHDAKEESIQNILEMAEYKKNGKVFVRSGAGIVADSVPGKEFEECINKAKAVMQALRLAEEADA